MDRIDHNTAPWSAATDLRLASPHARPDLIVFSHLRWSWVWQRPQHLVVRLARRRTVWFVEEPVVDPSIERPVTRFVDAGPVTVVRRHVPGLDRHIGFDAPEATGLGEEIAELAGGEVETVWLYTPLALKAARALAYRTLVFDVMDDLSSFKGASPDLPRWHGEALSAADVVLTGGRSLQESVLATRPDAHLFPSGVDGKHYAEALSRRELPGTPVAGYVGVIDERLDLDLVGAVADLLPEWHFRMVGPVAKIAEEDLPRRANVSYPGPMSYEELPATMATFDVALMPFAHNEATRRISPTKTLEYLAAGLPVVSTTVPDVVTDYGDIVRFADDPGAFAGACVEALGEAHDRRYHAACRPLLAWHDWDRIAARIETILESANRGAAEVSHVAMGRSA
ncbi:MAG TPA: glycosyltransferase [Ilumatobacter sp.]|jgi:glycosyltransferase involved in cell wall biosynthesis|nr:glycosyltransferase [Ilumatobacter sp.]